MLANLAAKFSQYSRGVPLGKTSRDTGGSNPPRSASQSAISALSAENSRIARMFPDFLPLRESEKLRFGRQLPDSARLSLSRTETAPFAHHPHSHRVRQGREEQGRSPLVI